MDERQMKRLHDVLCSQFGVRAGKHMLEYVQRRLSGDAPFPVLGADWRTGVPVHPMIDPTELSAALQSGESAS